MRNSPIGFHYSWQDIKPVRPLFVTVLVAQAIGVFFAIANSIHTEWFDSLWAGAALATFPGYIIGLAVQSLIKASRLAENKVMVRRMGLVALVFTMAAFFIPNGGIAIAL